MGQKVRKQIYIDPAQEILLKQLARKIGVSEAEIIRQAIDHYGRSLETALQLPRRNLRAWEQQKTFIQHLIDQGPVPGGRDWRREDLYDR